MSQTLETTGCTLWSINDGFDDYNALLLSVLSELSGTDGNSNIRRLDSWIKTLKDKIVFIEKRIDFPKTGDSETIYILKNDYSNNNLFVKSGIYIWDGTTYKYINKFYGNEISYDNVNSTLDATNVQDAIDELNETNEENVKRIGAGIYTSRTVYRKNDLFKYNGNMYLTESQFIGDEIPDFSKVYMISRRKNYDYFTIEIDTKNFSNPSRENGGITYFNGCEGFSTDDWVEWLGYKPCILTGQGGIETYLDPNDYSKDTNGNDVDITSFTSARNVMICFPRIGITAFNDWTNNKATIHITNDKNAIGYRYRAFNRNKRKSSRFYVGAYQGSVSDSKLFSVSGATRVASKNSLSSFRTLAQANGANYGIFDHTKLNFCKMLYIIQNGKINGKVATGIGSNTTTGFLNTSGMNVFDETQFSRKWLGMESNCDWEIVDGCGLDSDLHLMISNNTNYSDDITNYEDFGKVYTLGNGYTGSAFLIDDEIGIVTESNNGTAETYFHCPCTTKIANTIEMQGGSNVFEERFMYGSTTVANASARLCFMN